MFGHVAERPGPGRRGRKSDLIKWLSKGIGELYAVDTSKAGADVPPTNNSQFRFVKLTASDSYNTGVLTSESVSGSAPLVVATAVVSLAGSPLNGATVNLLNTEARFIRASTSPGTVQDHQMQGHKHGLSLYQLTAATPNNTGGANALASAPQTYSANDTDVPKTDGTNGTPLTGTENRPKNLGLTYFMRVK